MPGATVQAIRLHGPGKLSLDSIPHPGKPGADEVLVQIKRVGICGSDVHMFLNHWAGAISEADPQEPVILGHEGSGVIVEVGPGVTNVKPGDRVALEPTHKSGKYENLAMLSELALHRASKVHKLPDNVSFEEAAMCEPFAISLHAVRRAGVKPGDKVLVLGAGPIGQLALIAAKAEGASRVVVTDVKAGRLAQLKQFGADAAVDVGGLAPKEAAAKAKAAFDGDEIDIVVDAAGHESTIETGMIAVKEGGVVQMVGIATVKVAINLWQLLPKEIDLRGSWFYGPDYPTALNLIATKVDLKPLMSHRIPLSQAQEGYEWCAKAEDPEGKPVLKVLFNVSD